jgi:hypothetical protein
MEIGHPVNHPDRAWHTMDDTAEAVVLDISLQGEIAGFGLNGQNARKRTSRGISVA